MDRTIYIDQGRNGGVIGIIFSDPDIRVVFTGMEVHTEKDCPEVEAVERRCGLTFFHRDTPAPALYGVPAVTIFASDQAGGIYASAGDPAEGPIFRIGPDLTIELAAGSLEQLLYGLGGPPEQPPVPPRVFPSREEAEKVFPIQDLWSVLREKKEPRFQG